MDQKTAFISYSWSNELHENWVLALANRLVQDGVDVKLDKWDLKEGYDKFTFMETMVKDSKIDKVLIILDKQYAERANERKGGVGTETLIITPNVYEHTQQDKFIPVVAQLDDEGKPYLPTYLAGRIYVNLSHPEQFEGNYEKLLRTIYNRPSLIKPKLGTPPRHLFEETPMHFKTTAMVRGLAEQLNRNPGRANSLIRDFLDEFYKDLSEFIIAAQTNPTNTSVGEAIIDRLRQYLPLKRDYVDFFDRLVRSDVGFDFDLLLHFFEKLSGLFRPADPTSPIWRSYQFDHFKMIRHELFLYTVAIALRNKQYNLLEEIFYSKYLIKETGRQTYLDSFSAFYHHFDMIDEYYKKMKDRNLYSPQADWIVNNMPEDFPREDLVDADLLCFYIAQLHGWHWFPKTYVYKNEYNDAFEIFNRLISNKHFQKIKGVLGVESPEELKVKLIDIKAKGNIKGYDHGFSRIPTIESYIKIDEIASGK